MPSPAVVAPSVRPATEEALEILLVDDDDAVRGVILRVLRRLGHQVASFAGADEATVAARSFAFQVALVDLNLGSRNQGDKDGWQLLNELREQHPSACFVLTSGARPSLPSPDEGGPLFLQKPFSRSDLVDLLDHARREIARRRDG